MSDERRWSGSAAAVAIAAALGTVPSHTLAAEPPPPDLAYITGGVVGFVRIRVAELYDSPVGKQLRAAVAQEDPQTEVKVAREIGIPLADLASLMVVQSPAGELGDFHVLLTTRAPLDRAARVRMFGQPVKNDAGVEAYKLVSSSRFNFLQVVDNRTFDLHSLSASVALLKKDRYSEKNTPLRAALDQADGSTVAIGLNVDLLMFWASGAAAAMGAAERGARVIAPAEPSLPSGLWLYGFQYGAKYGLVSATFKLDGAEAALSLRLSGKQSSKDIVEDDRIRLGQWLGRAIAEPVRGVDEKRVRQLLRDLRTTLNKATITRDGSAVTLMVRVPAMLPGWADKATVSAAARSVADAADRSRNLELITDWLRGYKPDGYRFPAAATYAKDGKTPLLSWRVRLLPQIGESALYKEFNLEEPWDSEHNKKLIPRMPKVYLSPNVPPAKELGRTHYQVLVGGGAMFDPGPLGPRPSDITDAASNTLLLVEAAEAIPWTKPDDLAFDPAKPLPKFGADAKADFFLAAFCDGSIRAIRKNADEKALKALVTRAGGERVSFDDVEKR